MVLAALGFGAFGGRSENKLKISVENKDGGFDELVLKADVFFNPNEITIVKSVQWTGNNKLGTDADDPQFAYGNSRTLSMDLIFDTYEAGEPVTKYTELIFGLTTVKMYGSAIHRPPRCQLSWGDQWGDGGVFFVGVLDSLTQRFTLFFSDGTPARATLSCSFTEWLSPEENKMAQGTSSADVAKSRTVRQGDTLSSIAYEEYRDPALWRYIADRNGINNPRRLTPGQTLVIPAIRRSTTARK